MLPYDTCIIKKILIRDDRNWGEHEEYEVWNVYKENLFSSKIIDEHQAQEIMLQWVPWVLF